MQLKLVIFQLRYFYFVSILGAGSYADEADVPNRSEEESTDQIDSNDTYVVSSVVEQMETQITEQMDMQDKIMGMDQCNAADRSVISLEDANEDISEEGENYLHHSLGSRAEPTKQDLIPNNTVLIDDDDEEVSYIFCCRGCKGIVVSCTVIISILDFSDSRMT